MPKKRKTANRPSRRGFIAIPASKISAPNIFERRKVFPNAASIFEKSGHAIRRARTKSRQPPKLMPPCAQIPRAKKCEETPMRSASRRRTNARRTHIRRNAPKVRALSRSPAARLTARARPRNTQYALQRGRLAAVWANFAAHADCPKESRLTRRNFALKNAGRKRRRLFRALRRESARECRGLWIRQSRACRHSGARESAHSQTRTTNQAHRRAEPAAASAESPPFPEYSPSL